MEKSCATICGKQSPHVVALGSLCVLCDLCVEGVLSAHSKAFNTEDTKFTEKIRKMWGEDRSKRADLC